MSESAFPSLICEILSFYREGCLRLSNTGELPRSRRSIQGKQNRMKIKVGNWAWFHEPGCGWLFFSLLDWMESTAKRWCVSDRVCEQILSAWQHHNQKLQWCVAKIKSRLTRDHIVNWTTTFSYTLQSHLWWLQLVCKAKQKKKKKKQVGRHFCNLLSKGLSSGYQLSVGCFSPFQ